MPTLRDFRELIRPWTTVTEGFCPDVKNIKIDCKAVLKDLPKKFGNKMLLGDYNFIRGSSRGHLLKLMFYK